MGCRHRIFQHIEILGFTDQQISLYVKSALPENEAKDFEGYLASHPQIRAGMYIPLNSAIVVTVYEESQASGCAMPATLTELYTSLATTLLRRYMRGHPEYGTDCKSIQSFKDLPPPVYTKFYEVCKLAYTGTVGSREQVQLIYRKCNMPSGFDDLGLMDSAIELYETRPEATSYNFLHLTFQEFFAALHISSLSPEEQVEHFKRHEEGRLKVVLRFVAGINKLNCFSIEEIANFFKTPRTHKGSLISCDALVGIDHVQWLFEAQSDDVIKDVLGQKTIEFDSWSSDMLPLDYYSLGYCVSHSQCQWVLGLGGKEIGETEVKMLVAGAGTRSEPRGMVVGLGGGFDDFMVIGLQLSTNCLHMLFTSWRDILYLHQLSLTLSESCDRIIWPDLSALRVLGLEISGQTEPKLNTLLLPHLSLESLAITPGSRASCSLGYEDCVAIGNHVKSTTSLKELYIIADDQEELLVKLDEKGMEAITAALASNQSLPLERLELGCECTFTATAGESLAQFITNTTSLKHLSIGWCTCAHIPLVLARGINHNTTLTQLDLSSGSISDAGAVALAQALHHNSTLTKLALSYNSISDAGAVALAQALHHNSTLTELDLFGNSISDARAVALAQALHHNSTLTRLNLCNNSISDAGAVALAQALHHNSTLTRLNLSFNSISDAGVVALARALHHNSTLTQLNLSNNSISVAGAVALAQALHHNSTLIELNLNNISDAGAVALVQALHHNSTLTQLRLYGSSGIVQAHSTVKNRVSFHFY